MRFALVENEQRIRQALRGLKTPEPLTARPPRDRHAVNEIRIGLLGLGTVGGGVVKILQTHGAEIAGARRLRGSRLGAHRATPISRARARASTWPALPLGGDADRVPRRSRRCHIVIELIGGLEPARTFILRALAAGKHVVTANKALLAHHGAELFEEARRRGVMLGFEAAVAGGIPLIRAVKDGLAANRILSASGIVNGTCNYILSKMTDEGRDFAEVLKEAQAHGYAESDPTLDIEGMDSAHKLQILATLAFRTAGGSQGHLHRGHHRGDRAGHRQRAASSATASSSSPSPR